MCKCGSVDNYRTEKSGQHIKAICNICNSYIKFIPQGFTDDTLMFFGKYIDQRLGDIPISYLRWLYDNTKLNGSLKLYIESKIHQDK